MINIHDLLALFGLKANQQVRSSRGRMGRVFSAHTDGKSVSLIVEGTPGVVTVQKDRMLKAPPANPTMIKQQQGHQ